VKLEKKLEKVHPKIFIAPFAVTLRCPCVSGDTPLLRRARHSPRQHVAFQSKRAVACNNPNLDGVFLATAKARWFKKCTESCVALSHAAAAARVLLLPGLVPLATDQSASPRPSPRLV
jgi:hypothetical protein